VKRVERRWPASRLPDLRELAPHLRTLAQGGKTVPLLYVEFRSAQEGRGTRARLAAYKRATAAALKAAIGSIVRQGDIAAAGAGGRWFVVLLAGRAKPASSHNLDADLGVAAERLRQTVRRELARMRSRESEDALPPGLDVRCGWNVLEPSADPLEALQHAVRGAALVARIEERRATVLAAITHEVRTPLTAIIGFAERLRDDGLDTAAGQRSLDIIVDESRRLQRLTEGLIDMGSWNAGGLRLDQQRTNLAEIAIRACEALAERAAARGVLVVLKGDAVAHVDPDRCLQILINLLDNAVRHSPRGGTVTIRISKQHAGPKVSIEDQGQGFERDVMTAVGTPFQRGKGGTVGLGLAIARLLTDAHGGSLTLPRRRTGGMVEVTFSDMKARRAKNSAGPNTRL
jgi:signal transduction histidine kinase